MRQTFFKVNLTKEFTSSIYSCSHYKKYVDIYLLYLCGFTWLTCFQVCVEGNIGSGKTTFLNHFRDYESHVEVITICGLLFSNLYYRMSLNYSLYSAAFKKKILSSVYLKKSSSWIKQVIGWYWMNFIRFYY